VESIKSGVENRQAKNLLKAITDEGLTHLDANITKKLGTSKGASE